jgi:hypothetical protein
MKILGTSGVSIFLTAQIMRRHRPKVFLKDSEIKNNHTAVLRFRDDRISKFLNVPFKEVKINKGISYENKIYSNSNLKLSNMYSQKVTGKILDRSINNLSPDIRYIAPADLMDHLVYGLDIEYGVDINSKVFENPDTPTLSYCKMPDLMDKLGMDKPEFSFSPVYTLNAKIEDPECEVYQTLYYPGHENYYRASITGNQLIVEYIDHSDEIEEDIKTIMNDFGFLDYKVSEVKLNTIPVGKMSPINEKLRKDFIYKLTNDYNVWSFGRNGIWKSITLDRLFDDIHKIDRMITNGLYHRNQLSSI